MEIRSFERGDSDAVVALWERCGLTRPWNDPQQDIERKLAVADDLFLVGLIHNVVVATVMAGYDGHRGWINYLAVDQTRRRAGLAQLLMDDAERRLRVWGCAKINLQVRSDNTEALAFYERSGFGVDDVISMGKRLIADQTN